MVGMFLGGAHRKLLSALGVLEAAALFGAVYLASVIRFGGGYSTWPSDTLLPLWPKALLFAAIGIGALVAVGAYNPRLRDGLPGVGLRVVLAFAFQGVALVVLYYMAPQLELGRGVLALSFGVSLLALMGLRWGYLAISGGSRHRRKVLVVGAGDMVGHLMRFRRRTDFMGVEFVGFRPLPHDESVVVPEERLLDADEPVCAQAWRLGVDQIVVAAPPGTERLPLDELLDCRTQGITVTELVRFMEAELGLLKLEVLSPSWLVFSPGFNKRVLRKWTKRFFDVAVSSTLLLVVSPVILFAAAAIWLEGRGRLPVLYRQTRVGEEGILFELLKFRSMKPDAEVSGAQWARQNDPRVTRLGRWLRRYRVDELPQLFNILSGRMSFVGPRPERPEFVGDLEQQITYYAERHRVKPGLTGWAQVRYPYGASLDDAREKLQFDLYYAKNHSLLLDCIILMQTAEVVVSGRGVR